MQIIRLQVLGFLGLKTFETGRKLGKVNKLQGGNGAGKSSVVTAIKAAFKSTGTDARLINIKSERAEILIELDDNTEIRRRITPSGNDVKVTHDGQPLDKPQSYLNRLFGPTQLNPVEFYLNDAKERRTLFLRAINIKLDPKMLKESCPELWEIEALLAQLKAINTNRHGLDVLQEIQKIVYDRRQEIGRDVTRMEKAIEQDKSEIPPAFNVKAAGAFDLNKAIAEKTELESAKRQYDEQVKRLTDMRDEAKRIAAEIERLTARLEAIRAEGREIKSKVEGYQDRTDRIDELSKAIGQYQRDQKLAMKVEQIAAREKELEASTAEHETLDKLYKRLTVQVPRDLLATAKLPMGDIEIRGDDIRVAGVSIDMMSSSERIRFAHQLAKALAGELKVICVDGIEALDEEARAAFEKEALADEFGYFITQVTNGPLTLTSVGDLPGEGQAAPDTERKANPSAVPDDPFDKEAGF